MPTKKIDNLGKSVNSSQDDFAFSYNSEKKMGFMASNKEGNDNIYIVDPVCAVNLIASVTDKKTGQPIAGAKVDILDSNKKTLNSYTTDANGEIKSLCGCNKDHSLIVSKSGYKLGSAMFNSDQENYKVNIALEPIEVIITETEVILNPIFFEFNKHNITLPAAEELDRLVKVMKDNPGMIILVRSHTDNRGKDDYNLILSDRRAKSTVQYVISKGIDETRISAESKGETEPKVDCGENCTEDQHTQNRRSEFKIEKR